MFRTLVPLKQKCLKTGYQRSISNSQLVQAIYNLKVLQDIDQCKIADYSLTGSLRLLERKTPKESEAQLLKALQRL